MMSLGASRRVRQGDANRNALRGGSQLVPLHAMAPHGEHEWCCYACCPGTRGFMRGEPAVSLDYLEPRAVCGPCGRSRRGFKPYPPSRPWNLVWQ